MIDRDDLKRKIQAKLVQYDNERRQKQLDAWNNLKPFNYTYDVPQIPIVPKEEYQEFYVPRLIDAGAIPKKDLIDKQVYIGGHRRCHVARWNKNDNKFEYWRNKFGTWFIDTCNHFQDDDGFALFVPIKLGNDTDFKKPEY